MALQRGDSAPDFTLDTIDGTRVHLYSVLEQASVVLSFYVKAFTPVCAGQVCGLRDALPQFEGKGARVFGIGPDSPATSQRFSQHHHLPFPLLIDPNNKVRELYRVPKFLGFLPGRATYLIGADRTVKEATTASFRSTLHISESLAALK